MDVPLPLDKLALDLIDNEPSPANMSKYVPICIIFLFVYFVRDFSFDLIIN